MLEFHHDNGVRKGHRWHYVYFHGKAEQFGEADFNDGAGHRHSSAPDICIANRPISDFFPVDDYGNARDSAGVMTVVIHCLVHGQPALAVLSTDRGYPRFSGRIALINDIEALKHCLTPKDWR